MSTVIPGRVSVIIPAYKAAAFIGQALDSVLAQTYPDVEIIVVDDHSPEDLEEVLQPYRDRITYCKHSENKGISAARNTGSRAATGEILAFLDQDDWWPKNLLAQFVPKVKPGCAVLYDNFLVSGVNDDEGSDKTVFSEASNWACDRLTWKNMDYIFQGAPMFKIVLHRLDCKHIGGFDNRFFAVEDFNFFVKLLSEGVDLQIILEPKGYYRVHDQSTTVMIANHQQQDFSRQLRAQLGWLEMCRTMPDELTMNAGSIRHCQQGIKYWGARYTETAIRQLLSERNYADILRLGLTHRFIAAIPEIASIRLEIALSRVSNRIKKKDARGL